MAVIFQMIDGKVSATGTTDGAGTFKLSTYTQDDGAPVGLYKVTVAPGGAEPVEIEEGVLAPQPEEGEGGGGGPKSPVPAKYPDPQKTDLTADVKESGTNQFSFDLK